jgi:hypothetical protein
MVTFRQVPGRTPGRGVSAGQRGQFSKNQKTNNCLRVYRDCLLQETTMARPLRIEYAGAFYHVTSRGNEQKDVFKSQKDREKFLDYLASATERYGAVLHAYCLMTNIIIFCWKRRTATSPRSCATSTAPIPLSRTLQGDSGRVR